MAKANGRSVRGLLVLLASMLVAGVTSSPGSAQTAKSLFADGFESGGFAAWTTVVTAGDGVAVVQAEDVKAGGYAARFTSTSTPGSVAYARANMPANQTRLSASGDFKVTSEGPAGANVPILRLFDATGRRVVSLYRQNQDADKLWIHHSGVFNPTDGFLPLNSWARLELIVKVAGADMSTVEVLLNGSSIYTSTSASLGDQAIASVQIGNNTSGQAFGLNVDDVAVTAEATAAPADGSPKLLIADLRNRRLLITDFDGRLIWKFDNPTGRSHPDSGPLGVRWMPNNQILATFGTGEVGLIDVATKSWLWQTSGFNGDWFQSPYDAEILPDGNLAVAMRFNEGGRISVYNRSTGEMVWKHLLSHAHSIKYRTEAQSYKTRYPTLLVGGWGALREVAYRPNGGQNVTWSARTEYTHDAIVVENDLLLTTEGYYIQKIDRRATQIWRHPTPLENRRIAVNPFGGYIYTVGEGDKVEFRDTGGNLLRDWSLLSDGSQLDYPYGVQVIDFFG